MAEVKLRQHEHLAASALSTMQREPERCSEGTEHDAAKAAQHDAAKAAGTVPRQRPAPRSEALSTLTRSSKNRARACTRRSVPASTNCRRAGAWRDRRNGIDTAARGRIAAAVRRTDRGRAGE